MTKRTAFLLGVVVALAIPASAGAATPASGTVSPTAKKATATGTITDPLGAYDLAAFFAGGTTVRGQDTCKGAVCDPYPLTVNGGRELRIVVDAPTAENVSLDV